MTPLTLAQLVRYRTKTNATTLTDTNLLMLLNVAKDDIATEVVKADEDFFGMPQTADLVENQREYPMPTDQLNHFKLVEAKLDGTNFITLSQFDLVDKPMPTDETTILARFSNEQGRAFYDIFRNSLWIYSGAIADVAAGLKLWSYAWPADITDLASVVDMSIDPTNTSPGFPRAFHELLARRVSIEYKSGKDKPIPLTDSELKFDVDLRDKIDSITGMDKRNVVTGDLPSMKDEYNNGFNL